MSYYRANQLRVAAKWTRRVGYLLAPVVLFMHLAAGQGTPDGYGLLLRGALVAALVLAATEGAGVLIEKIADREAKR